MSDLTLLSKGQIFGDDSESQLEVIKKYGPKAAITDLCILTGCCLIGNNHIAEDNSLTGRTSAFWTKSNYFSDVCAVLGNGFYGRDKTVYRNNVVRPALQSSVIFSQILSKKVSGYNGTEEVEYGEYPQNAADSIMQKTLEAEYLKGINKTGRSYTFDSVKDYGIGFRPITYEEYEYQGRKYIRVKANAFDNYGIDKVPRFQLSNGVEYKNGDYVWVEVSPVKWLVDDKTGILISKKGLVSGIMFLGPDKGYNPRYDGNFNMTDMKKYFDKYMFRDLTQPLTFTHIQHINPYGLNFDQVSEEEIIKGAIESGVAVFLHGPSSEGKSARVKQIDPTCEIIYLRNATPDSLNGKSVYDGSIGKMIDIPPTWLKRLKEKCEMEPDKLHVVFFDEITNALPSIQGIAFNIVLDREVNGIWKLPDNARIVAAGNDMKDSLAANQLAEPLFNRFAHVYIKTTTESWLKWASENNIHPAIYSYIAYKKGETLRSKYDGEKPNADPRKWEMASKMLYATGNPEMLRALVGEDITREFVQFCNQPVITLDDVINENYTDYGIQTLNTAERYATTIGLSQVDDNNLEKVREFVIKLGAEFVAIFDALWTHGDESRLERLAEAKLAEMPEGDIKK